MHGKHSLSAARGRGMELGWLLVACVLATAAAGCDEKVVIHPEGADQGLVIVLPGIDGRSGYSLAACRALCEDVDCPFAVELTDWTSPLGAIHSQTAQGRNREVASGIADRIVEYRQGHPTRCVYLIGHSGGTAVAVWAVEALPEGEHVDGIILLASSLSPGYDLSAALIKSRGGIVNFYSPRDGILGAGTTILGTMDGRHGESAGKAGFEPHFGPGYEKLRQVPWAPPMAKAGNGGDHFGCMKTGFVAEYIRPLIRRGGWDATLVASADDEAKSKPAPDSDDGFDDESWLIDGEPAELYGFKSTMQIGEE